PLTDFGGKTSIFSHPVYLFLREFSLQDFRGGSCTFVAAGPKYFGKDQKHERKLRADFCGRSRST
ncbi:hypothetical protein, partial [Escherichia coli]|uniref:hypothetical protein n=1 Tax=Escherichia coli TaxID=562 RepID=UPI001F46FA84